MLRVPATMHGHSGRLTPRLLLSNRRARLRHFAVNDPGFCIQQFPLKAATLLHAAQQAGQAARMGAAPTDEAPELLQQLCGVVLALDGPRQPGPRTGTCLGAAVMPLW